MSLNPLRIALFTTVFLLSFVMVAHSTFGQTNAIPGTPFEARIWLKNSNNSFEENELGQVVKVTIDYVPRVFVIGDLEVFPNLEELSVNYSGRFYDRHFSGVARLKNLKVLRIKRCDEITEASLAVLNYLPKLEEIVLEEVESLFSLAPLIQCKSLKRITFKDNNHFDFEGLESLGELSQIQTLDLSENRTLEDKHLRHLKRLSQLESLDLSNCHALSDEGLKSLAPLSRLKELNVHRCKKLTGEFLKVINPEMESLNLYGCDLSDSGAKQVSRFAGLKVLRISSNAKLTEAAFDGLGDCKNLEVLDVSGLPIQPHHFEQMASLLKLKQLDLSGCKSVTGESVGLLKGCVELETLKLEGCRRIDSPDIKPLVEFPNLKSLELANTRIKIDGVRTLAEFPSLEEIDLSRCKWIDDEAIAALATVVKLKKVKLNRIERLSDVSLTHLAKLPNLEVLEIDENKKLTGEGFASFLPGCKLRRLHLQEVDRLSPGGLKHLVSLKNLEYFSINCKNLSNEHLIAMMGMPKLKSFTLDDTEKVSNYIYRRWTQSLPNYGH